MPDVALTVNGHAYGGWTDVRIRTGIEQMSGAFSVGYTERWAGRGAPWPIRPGDACAVAVDGTTVITGHVDDVGAGYDGRSHGLRLSGRDAAGDLVDCSAANSPGHWQNRTLTQIVDDICRPFGIAVSAEAPVGGRFKYFALQPGETAYEAVERLCRFRGVLPVSSGDGRLSIVGPGTQRVPVRLVQGENILAADGMLTWRDRYKDYIVKGADSGIDDSTPEQNAGPRGSATDPNVHRHRPLIIVSEEPGNAVQLQKRALWEAAVRAGRSARAAVTVAGWSHPGGLWRPNRIVNIASPWMQLDADMLIVAVTLLRGPYGTRTELELCRPEGFAPIPVVEREEITWIG